MAYGLNTFPMKTNFIYTIPVSYNTTASVECGGTIGQMIRSAYNTGIMPDMPTPELGNDADLDDFDSTTEPFVDPYGDIRSDWSALSENGLPRGFGIGQDGFTAPISATPVEAPAETPTPTE